MTKSPVTDEYFQQSELKRRSFRFGGYKATSQKIVWPILLLLSLNTSSAGISDNADTRIVVWNVTISALVCAVAYFTILGWLINKGAPQLGSLRTWLIAFLYATTELVRAVLIQLFAQYSGLETNPQWDFRVVAATTTGLLIFALVSTVVNDSASYRAAYRDLFTRRVQLRSVVETSLESLIRARDQLIDTTREQLSQSLRETLSETEKKSPEYPKIIHNLYAVAEETVRPLSHALFESPIHLTPSDITSKPPRVPWTVIIQRSSLIAPFRPGLLTALAALLSLPSLLLVFNLTYLAQWLLALGLIYLANEIARRYLTAHLRSIPFVLRLVVISLIYALPAIFFVQVALSELVTQVSVMEQTLLYGTLIGNVVGWLMASSAGMRSARLELLTEINVVNEELAWQNARIQSELWIDQKSLALTLHNDVQASLLAAALKLKAAFDKGEDLANQTLPEIRELISRSINFGSAQSRNRTLSDAVRRINDTWAGIITLDVTASQDATSALERDVVGLGVLEDVLSEFQNNSLKHGKATEITAALSMPENDVLHVVLTNNGQPLRQDFHSGLGSAFMKSVALKYALENIDGGVQLVLLLPLSPTTSTS